MKIDFENKFEDILLTRGYDYFLYGKVSNVNKTGKYITADVCGSQKYSVKIEVENGKYITGSCTCPYSDGVDDCKHIVALLYYLNNEEMVNKSLNSERLKSENAKSYDIFSVLNDVINNIDQDDINNFLYDALIEDSDLLEKFREEFIDYFEN